MNVRSRSGFPKKRALWTRSIFARLRGRLASSGLVVLTVAAAAGAAAPAAQLFATGAAATGGPTFAGSLKAPLLYPPRRSAGRPAIVAGQTYTIADVGAPKATKFPGAVPIGFNNTGQMYGAAPSNPSEPGSGPVCLEYTGAAFIEVTTAANIAGCEATSISDLNANGVFSLVGAVATWSDPNPSALVATTPGNGRSAKTKLFSSFPFSVIDGINASGAAFGHSFNSAFSGGATLVPYTFSGTAPAALQPACVVPGNAATGCLSLYGYQPAYVPYSCPFGGCAITNSGVVLAYDGVHQMLGVVTPTTTYDLPQSFTDTNGYTNDLGGAQMSNAGLLATDYVLLPAGFVGIKTATSAFGSSGWTVIPALANSCSEHVPLSMNNSGEILGYDTACGVATDAGYWTWDPQNGVQSVLMPSTALYSSAMPLGVNDNAQILVVLNLVAGGQQHWGTFNPVAAARPGKSLSGRRPVRPVP